MLELSSLTLTFNIPSLIDNVSLDCRIYNPRFDVRSSSWAPKAAVIAHPYAPLGGCQDDPIVHCLVDVLLSHDYIVGTFNFRGASPSSGHTSWTAKPETQDYISIAGLLAYYLQHLSSPMNDNSSSLATTSLLLAGYSYGALITTLLPPPSTSISIFDPLISPRPDTAAHTIRLRAQQLATTYLSTIPSPKQVSPSRGRSPTRSLQPPQPTRVAVGSAETSPGVSSSRMSHESQRRSMDAARLRQSAERARVKLQQHFLPSGTDNPDEEETTGESKIQDTGLSSSEKQDQRGGQMDAETTVIETLLPPKLGFAYLLVSPPVGSLASLATMFSASAMRKGEEKFLDSQTLVVYGDEDGFTGQRRYRRWCEDLDERSDPREHRERLLSWKEIAGAGHFWREKGTEAQLKDTVRTWVRKIDDARNR